MAPQASILDLDRLIEARDWAKDQTVELFPDDPGRQQRWCDRIDDAYSQILEQPRFFRDSESGNPLFVSSRHPATLYEATSKTCTCPAARNHNLCWHRVAARLLEVAERLPKPSKSKETVEQEMQELFA